MCILAYKLKNMKIKIISLTTLLFSFGLLVNSCTSKKKVVEKETETIDEINETVENSGIFDDPSETKTIDPIIPKLNGKELTNELIWYSGEFRTSYVSGVRSMNDGKHYTSLDQEKGYVIVNKYLYATNEKTETIVSSENLKDEKGNTININDYQFSADETKLLIASEQEQIYRHSSKSFYYIYDIKSKKTYPLSDKEKGKQRLADFSPNGNLVAFVRENNLFYKNLETNKEYQITFDGELNKYIYGATDWVYEEEFSFHKGFHWNDNGSKIAYYRFDESNVKEFQITYYGSLYPNIYKFKYPKAGEANSKVSVYIYDISTTKNKSIVLPGKNDDIYLPRIKWTKDPNVLTITKLNRLQNKLDLLKVNCKNRPKNGGVLSAEVMYSETSDTYVDIHDNLTFWKEGHFLWTSEKNGYNHIYVISKDGKETQVTKGNWDVAEVKGIDVSNDIIYYISTEEGPNQRQLYSIKTDGSDKTKLSTKKGFNDAIFSNTFDYYINYHSDANTPYYITLHKKDGSIIKVLEDNERLVAKMKEYDFQTKEFFSFKTSEDIELNGWMIKPPNFDNSKKYPVFMTFYNGPGINLVNDSWGGGNLLWHQLLAQKGYIVVCVDGRGTGYRGKDFKHITYLQLGKYETIDQIETAKYLATLDYVDPDRIGCQGWSYGGYMASLCMTKGADYFKAGIAVAPVTNWRYYDNIYTERFMRTPQENGDSYDSNSPINHVEKLKGKYLLVHGGGDDNVHPQNTMEMINALVKANKQFDLFYYPNRNHGIYGGTTRLHLYTKMTDFLLLNL